MSEDSHLGESTNGGGQPDKKLVQIVEDDRSIRDAIHEVLEDHGYRLLAASNGKEALEQLRTRAVKPCLILLDVMMPVLDGWGFRAAQRGDPELSAIPVVVLTALPNGEQTAHAMGAAGYLGKPVELEVLLKTIETHCQNSPLPLGEGSG
jgi:CheY-like chemotaxis protein